MTTLRTYVDCRCKAISFAFMLLLASLIGQSAVAADSAPQQEYRIKATYLYKISHFIDWPATAFTASRDCFQICVMGKQEVAGVLTEFNGKTVKKKELKVRMITAPLEIESCHVLFIGISEKMRANELLNAAAGKHILTASDLPDFLRIGGMLQLINLDDKVRFDINLRAAKEHGLVISSQLLQLAHDVVE